MTHKENVPFDPLHYIMLGILFILVVYFTMACKPIKEIVVTDTTNQTETKKDTTNRKVFAPDSLKLRLLFECDSNNNVLIRENSELKSKGFNTSYNFSNNTFDLSIYTDSIEQLNRIIETTKNKETVLHSPLDEVIQAENESIKKDIEKAKKDNDKLSNKLENRNRLSLYLSIALIVIVMFLLIRSKFR